MSKNNEKPIENNELDYYADGSITSDHHRIPRWLKWIYITLPIWGIIWLLLYWNGTGGWLDRGYWIQLQRAANTTYPYINVTDEQKLSK